MGGEGGRRRLAVQEQWVYVFSCGVNAFSSAIVGERGVCSCVVGIPVKSRVLTCLNGKYARECSFRDENSSKVEFRE